MIRIVVVVVVVVVVDVVLDIWFGRLITSTDDFRMTLG